MAIIYGIQICLKCRKVTNHLTEYHHGEDQFAPTKRRTRRVKGNNENNNTENNLIITNNDNLDKMDSKLIEHATASLQRVLMGE